LNAVDAPSRFHGMSSMLKGSQNPSALMVVRRAIFDFVDDLRFFAATTQAPLVSLRDAEATIACGRKIDRLGRMPNINGHAM
jgi:hypothetical protein